MKKDSVESIVLLIVIFLAVYAPVLKSNVFVTMGLIILFLLLPCSFNKTKLYFSFFLIPTFLFCLAFSAYSALFSVANMFVLSMVVFSLRQEQIIKCFWLCLYSSWSFIVIAIIHCIVDGTAISTFSMNGRILDWYVMGVNVNANLIGLYSALIVALCVICIYLDVERRTNRLLLLFFCIPIAAIGFVLAGSRSAALFIIFFIVPLLVGNIRILASAVPSLLIIYCFFCDDLLELRAFDFFSGDSGRFQFYKDAYNLWIQKSFLPLNDKMLSENNIILDNLFLGAIFRYGIFMFIGVLFFCFFILYRLATTKNKKNLPCSSLAFSSVGLGFVESSFIGSFFLLLIVLMCSVLKERR